MEQAGQFPPCTMKWEIQPEIFRNPCCGYSVNSTGAFL